MKMDRVDGSVALASERGTEKGGGLPTLCM